jgi:hypothetical protein
MHTHDNALAAISPLPPPPSAEVTVKRAVDPVSGADVTVLDGTTLIVT